MEANIPLFKITSAKKRHTHTMQHWPQNLVNHTKENCLA